MLKTALSIVGDAAKKGMLPNSTIKDGELHFTKLERQSPETTDRLVLPLYRQLPQIRITDLLLEVDRAIEFT